VKENRPILPNYYAERDETMLIITMIVIVLNSVSYCLFIGFFFAEFFKMKIIIQEMKFTQDTNFSFTGPPNTINTLERRDIGNMTEEETEETPINRAWIEPPFIGPDSD
jgi:hypothetical protein